ncbi:MAG TPA: hypothetical protein VGK02_08110 [Candidatus Aquicultor sp.]|jgi:hypothetical protein
MTDFNYNAAQAAAIDQDIEIVREQLIASAFSGHSLLAEQERLIETVPLARLLFITASLGTYRPDQLRPVAVGLELLRLAAEIHYWGPRTCDDRNLNLVTADYYYAYAIKLAATTNVESAISYMVQAIADITKGETMPDASKSYRGASIFETAVRLGVRLGECESAVADTLHAAAVSCCELYHLQYDEVSDAGAKAEQARSLKDRALDAAQALPAFQAGLLGDLLAAPRYL